MKAYKKTIAILFLCLFGSMQLLELHSLEHDTTDSDCDICKVISHDNDDDVAVLLQFDVKNNITPLSLKESFSYLSLYKGDRIYSGFFNKPPPSLV